MRKHFIKIILIFTIIFIFGVSSVKAMCGDLVYDVLNMKITDKNIKINGWAFIHKTQNGYRRKNNKADTESSTNQKIKINLCNQDKSICYFGDTEGIIDGNGYNFDNVMGYTTIKDGKEYREMNYTYQNIGFDVTFEVEKIRNKFNKEGEQNLYFTIAVTNDDYTERKCSGTDVFNKITNPSRYLKNDKYWVEEKMKILDEVISGNTNNENIEIRATGTDKILYTGWHTGTNDTRIGWGQIYQSQKDENSKKVKIDPPNNTNSENPGQYIIKARRTKDTYYSTGEAYYYYTCANYNEKGKYDDGYLNVIEYENGYTFSANGYSANKISTNATDGFQTSCSDTWIEAKKNISYAKVYGETTLKIKVKSDKKCEVSEPTHDKEMKCNNWTNLSSTCKELTVRNGNSSATVKIVQNGYISNIFKSNLVNNDKDYDASSYDGGWFKYGIIYYNEVSWESPNLSQDNEKKIEEAMKYRLKTMEIFTENLNLTINGLDGSRLIKKCTESGEFKNGKKLVTVCTFFLPDIDAISSTGKVSYKESDDNDNINNKYYIPFNEKEHSVSVILTGLSRLSENKAKKDSKDKNKSWFGTWEIDTGCKLKVINRLYNPPGEEGGDGKLKYKFIYRPIDLSNPFPNRFPGVNWYSWYIVENNKGKKTLEDSYKKLEYSAELNNATISKIKNYNKENTYFGEVDEDFFKTYIIKEGGNS